MKIDSDNQNGINRNVTMSNIVRQINAESDDVAIGKFVISTVDIKALKKLDIECYELSDLRSIE